jgi:hypothetical protein
MKRRYNLCIRGHLGLGDTIITAPIVREKASIYDLVCVLAKHHNLSSTEYLFRDVPNVVVRGVLDDQDADFFAGTVWKDEVLRIGMFGEGYDGSEWDCSMYRQAGVEFSDRWNKWACVRDEQAEDRIAKAVIDPIWGLDGEKKLMKYVFIHEDKSRGLVIDRDKYSLPKYFAYEPHPRYTPILFHWRKVIEACDEIHAIPSSFAAFIDSIVLPKQPKLFLHHYVRGNEPLCKLGKAWEILT